MELWASKLLTLLLLLTLTLVFGLLPVLLVRTLLSSRTGSRGSSVISALNCVAGGVFLGTTFLHLLPEVQEAMTTVLKVKGIDNNKYHVAECIICAGFFLVMFIEHLIMTLQHHYSDVNMESVDSPAPVAHSDFDVGKKTGKDDECIAVLGKAVMTHESGEKLEQNMAYANYGSTASVDAKVYSSGEHDTSEQPDRCKKSGLALPLPLQLGSQEKKHSGCGGEKSPAVPRSKSMHPVLEEGGAMVHTVHTMHQQHHYMGGKQLKAIRSFVLLMALSLHTVFEGMALGLQASGKDVWTLFGALAMHKSIIAFTLGLQFAENVAQLSRVLLFIVVFSLMSPVGIVVGIVVSEASTGYGTDLANAVLQGIATGTFIHVTFFEVLQGEVGQDHNVLKVLAVIVGFVIIELMTLI